MKILHVITSLYIGGAEKLMVDLLPMLRYFGNDVEILIFNNTQTAFYKQLESEGIKIHSFGKRMYNPLYTFRIIPFLYHYDIIHTHNTPCQYAVAMAKILSIGSSAKLVTTEHNTTNRRRGNILFYLFDKFVYSQYLKIICISDKTKINLENHIGLSPKILTIYNGIDLSKFSNQLFERQDKMVIITMIAGFREQKDQETLIKAMKELPDAYHLLLVGDGERRNILESLVAELDLSKRVTFLGIRNDIPNILNESDIIVLSSHWEGLSLSSIEGMASGKPFIASDVDGLNEIVKGHGILFPEGDYRKLANEIKHLSTDKEYYQEVAQKCRAKALQYDISIMAAKYNDLYKSLNE